MMVREFRESDRELLTKLAAESGFPYPREGKAQSYRVVVDDHDQPVVAALAEPIIQLFLISDKRFPPVQRLHAIRLLHRDMAQELRILGFNEANVFLPPSIECSFGNRLMKTFGWQRNWNSFYKQF